MGLKRSEGAAKEPPRSIGAQEQALEMALALFRQLSETVNPTQTPKYVHT